ncbi:MAG TPA: hypothetical protein VF619_13260 [Allosphingosinicella sp.]|jgi:hypothetical protein
MRCFPMLLLLLASPSAHAAEWKAEDPTNRTVIELGAETLGAVLAKTGAKPGTEMPGEPGTSMATFPNGRKVVLSLNHCDDALKKCGGLMLMSFLNPPPGWNEARLNAAMVNHLSSHHFATIGFVDGPRSPMIMVRSIIAEFGMPQGQLYRELTDFALSVQTFDEVLKAPAAAK